MSNTHPIVHQVEVAQVDLAAADDMIREYMPFIRSETAKFLNRPPVDSNDDELSIAMIAFHEAIQGYERQRGSFLAFAAQLIRNRLIDYYRKEKWHRGVLSLNEPVDGDDGYEIMDTWLSQRCLNKLRLGRQLGLNSGIIGTDGGVWCRCRCSRQLPAAERTLEACRRCWLMRGMES